MGLTAFSRIFAAELRYLRIVANTLPSDSATSVTVGPGPHTLTIETGLQLEVGTAILLERSSSSDHWVLTKVKSYNSATGYLVTWGNSLHSGQETSHSDFTVFDAPLRMSTERLVTRSSDEIGPIPYRVALQRALNHERTGYSIQRGFPELGGIVEPGRGSLVLSNGDGKLDWLRDVTFEGQSIKVYESATELDSVRGRYVPESSSDWKAWFIGAGTGTPEVSTTKVSVGLGDFTAKLKERIQTRQRLGLGGALRGDGSTSSTTKGVITDAHEVTDGLSAMTVMVLVKPSSNDVDEGNPAGSRNPYVALFENSLNSPFWIRVQTNGKFRVRVRTDGLVSSNVIDSGDIVAGQWVWLVITFDSTEEEMKLYSRPMWSSETEMIDHGAQTVDGNILATTTDCQLMKADGSQAFGGSLAHFRIYDRSLSSSEISEALRPLDLEDSEDVANLKLYVPFDDRFGSLAADLIGNRDAILTDANWDTTGSGRPEDAGSWFPVTGGRAVSVPLTFIDRLPGGDLYTCNFRSIEKWRYVLSAGVALSPKEDTGDVDIDWDVNRRLAKAVEGSQLFERFVPGMQFDWTPKGGSSTTLTVEDVWPERLRIVETPAAGGIINGSLVTVNPGWEVYQQGSADLPTLILISGSHNDPLTAWVDGDNAGASGWAETFQELLTLVCSELGPSIPAGNLDFSRMSRGGFRGNFYIGTQEVEALDTVAKLSYSIGASVTAEEAGDSLEFYSVELDSVADAVDSFSETEVENLTYQRVKNLPSDVVVGFSKAHHTLTGDLVGAAWQRLVDQAREEYQTEETPLPNYIRDRIETAAPSTVMGTLLTGRGQARAEGVRRANIARSTLWKARLSRGLDTLRMGDKIKLHYHRYGFSSGREVFVVKMTKVPDPRRLDVVVLLPPEDLTA